MFIAYNLQNCDILLPPQILLNLGAHGRQQIIGIHDDVNEGVDEAQQSAMTTGKVLDANEGAHWHQCVMIQVQKRNLTLLLAQHKEHRVQQLTDLGNIIKPNSAGHLETEERVDNQE